VPTLDKVSLDIQVVLGTTTMPIHQVLRLGRGAIIELEASEDDEVAILANNFQVATGTVIVSGNRIAVEVKDMAPKSPDVR
jgi:flagellar motor switch protein FliN/FliY